MENAPGTELMSELPDIKDKRILKRTISLLRDLSRQKVYEAEYAQDAPKFKIRELVVLDVLMSKRPNPLTFEQIQSPQDDGYKITLDDEELMQHLQSLLSQGIVEEMEVEDQKYYNITEIGAIIFKMYVLAGKLVYEATNRYKIT